MAGWFYKYETVYAGRIYEALGERALSDMTPERLRLPEEKIQRYREKARYSFDRNRRECGRLYRCRTLA